MYTVLYIAVSHILLRITHASPPNGAYLMMAALLAGTAQRLHLVDLAVSVPPVVMARGREGSWYLVLTVCCPSFSALLISLLFPVLAHVTLQLLM